MKQIEKLIKDMKLKMPAEEIPAALERMIEDRHQKEMEDLLLKLYEQKAIQLKEEVLHMLEEKLARQEMLKSQANDRIRGLEAISSRGAEGGVDLKDIA